MITCPKSRIRTVFPAVLVFFVFCFSVFAQKSPAPNIADPEPSAGGVLPKADDPLPTQGDSKTVDSLPSPDPSTGEFVFAEGDDPLIFSEAEENEQVVEPGKNDPSTPSVPGMDNPSVESPKYVVDSPTEKGSGENESDPLEKKESNETGSADENKKDSPDGKEVGEAVFVPIIRTLEATDEKNGSHLFGGKILADGGSTVLGAGVEFSLGMNFGSSTRIPFALRSGKASYRVKNKKLEAGTTYFYRAYVRNSAGVNFGSVKRLKVPESEDKRGWWSEDEKVAGGWRKSKWFGNFRKQEDMDWVYHEKLGWTYVVSDQRDGLWLWQKENGWTWTQKGVWPCLWRNKTGSWLCLMGAYQGKPVFYDYASRKVKNRTEKQDKTDKSKAMEVKTKSEKGQSSKEQDPKNGQASKEKQGEKVSEKTMDSGKSVDSKATESKTKISYIRERDSSRSIGAQAGNREKEPEPQISDEKELAPTDPLKNDSPVGQFESLDPKSGNRNVRDASVKLRATSDSKIDNSSQADSTYRQRLSK